jgi:hypothetical protein
MISRSFTIKKTIKNKETNATTSGIAGKSGQNVVLKNSPPFL